ncbi:hypothetical protein SOASR031_17740 [Leminorella grimontii]|nr:hypothetical protein SOASR031_17740 [Leminorella grimontii]
MFKRIIRTLLPSALMFYCLSAFAAPARLAIVIDDFGYRKHNEEQVLSLTPAISVAILPNAPLSKEMAQKAYQNGNEILIHMPMAPISKQPLERDTLKPTMGIEEIRRIIAQAIRNVPHAKGMNNHMGSAMTSDLEAMRRVMKTLSHYQLYFLDSMTIGSSKATQAAEGTSVQVVKRKVFLDDDQSEIAVRKQFLLAVRMAQENGSAIAIGHPHPSTVRTLQLMIPELPADVKLVPVSALLPSAKPHSEPEESQKKMPDLSGFQQCSAAHSHLSSLAYKTVKTAIGATPATLSLDAYMGYCQRTSRPEAPQTENAEKR